MNFLAYSVFFFSVQASKGGFRGIYSEPRSKPALQDFKNYICWQK